MSGGVLGSWETKDLSKGTYTLRLRLNDSQLGELRYVTTVTVDQSSGSNSTDGGSQDDDDNRGAAATISSPGANEVVSGRVVVRGTATSASYLDATLEYGKGASPSSWTTIDRIGNPVRNGGLGSWDTSGLDPGVYTLRLTVRDRAVGNIQTTTSVVVQ